MPSMSGTTVSRRPQTRSCSPGARGDNRVLISADTDFGTLLAKERAYRPSIVLIRRLAGRRAAEQAAIILANLDAVADDLDGGAVVVLTDEWVRVRRLPIVS